MSWEACTICKGGKEAAISETTKTSVCKSVNYHEPCTQRPFRITIIAKCQDSSETNLESLEPLDEVKKVVNFYVNLSELSAVCSYFQKFETNEYLEISTNCSKSWISGPEELIDSSGDCRHDYTAHISPNHFHAFIESACPSLYAIRPMPITMSSIIPVLDMLSHFHSEPLLTNCERVLMATDINQLESSLLIRLLDKGLCVSLDHRILGRILCVCLMNAAKLDDVSQELTGTVGSVFAQAFVANAAKSFRHMKPLKQNPVWQDTIRHLIPSSSANQAPKTEKTKRKQKNGGKCDHSEESFECILCFDQRCGKCKGENAFCYKALDNFMYEVRVQLYPHTYKPHLDRELLREDRINDYIMRHQLQPLPNNID